MANRYGEAALLAARQTDPADPAARWQAAMRQLYATSPVAQRKSGPRGAFLGLCEQGLVKGIPAGKYSATPEHKVYAVAAARMLLEAKQSWSITSLWKAATGRADMPHTGQLDVVMALWKNGLLT